MDRYVPGLWLWESTRPRLFLVFACSVVTLPRLQRRVRSARFAAESRSPLSSGTTHAPNVFTVSVAFGVALDAQELASDTWKTSAAPVCIRTAGVPTSAVAPSPESAANPR